MSKDYPEFSADQLMQLDDIDTAAQSLIDVLLNKPTYLRSNNDSNRIKDFGVHPMVIADIVAEVLSHRGHTVYFPTRIENCRPEVPTKSVYISDVYQ